MAINKDSKITIWNYTGSTTPTKQQLETAGVAVSFVPQTYDPWAIQAVDYEAGRVASGDMERNMVNEKRKANMTLPPMHTAQFRDILRAISGISHQNFWATIIDPMILSTDPQCITGVDGEYTGIFYVGDRSATAYSWGLDLWEGIKFDFIEV